MEEATVRKGTALLEKLDAARRILERVSFDKGPAVVDWHMLSSQVGRVPGLLLHIRIEVNSYFQEEIARIEHELAELGKGEGGEGR